MKSIVTTEKLNDSINKTIKMVTDRAGDKYENLAYDYMLLSDVYNNAGAYDLSIKAINKSLKIHNQSGAQENSFLMQILTYKALAWENLKLDNESVKIYQKIDNFKQTYIKNGYELISIKNKLLFYIVWIEKASIFNYKNWIFKYFYWIIKKKTKWINQFNLLYLSFQIFV